MGTRMCGNVGAVDKEKTSLHVLNVPQTVFPICKTRTKFPGADHFYQKNGSWGTIFPLKISVQGTKILRTKTLVTELQWHIITPFLDISLVAKIVFLGSCYHQGKKILVEKPLSAERDSRAISLAFKLFHCRLSSSQTQPYHSRNS